MSQETGELRDQLSIDTPELVSLQFPLAGIGSRGLAWLLDLLIQLIAVAILVVLTLFLVPSLGRFASSRGDRRNLSRRGGA